MRRLLTAMAAGLACLIAAADAKAAILSDFYVGVDGRAKVTYGGQSRDNPNLGRLTFLYEHGDHFHGIGSYSLTGDPNSPTILDTNGNNRIPELFTGQEPLRLTQGTGAFAGRRITQATPGVEYSDLEMRSIHDLTGFPPGSPEDILFNSSSGRWTGSLAGSEIALELVSITAGLQVADASGNVILTNPGDQFVITPPAGDGTAFSFLPVLFTDLAAPLGAFTAEFRLLDLGTDGGRTPFAASGRFGITVQAVPEPSTLAAMAAGAVPVALVALRRRRRSSRGA